MNLPKVHFVCNENTQHYLKPNESLQIALPQIFTFKKSMFCMFLWSFILYILFFIYFFPLTDSVSEPVSRHLLSHFMLSSTVQLFWPIQGEYRPTLAQTVRLLNPQLWPRLSRYSGNVEHLRGYLDRYMNTSICIHRIHTHTHTQTQSFLACR